MLQLLINTCLDYIMNNCNEFAQNPLIELQYTLALTDYERLKSFTLVTIISYFVMI